MSDYLNWEKCKTCGEIIHYCECSHENQPKTLNGVEMELSDAFDEIAKIILKTKYQMINPGWPIMVFCGYLKDAETPGMALALVKKDLRELDE